MALTVGTPVVRADGWTQVSVSQSAAAVDDVLLADPGDGVRYVIKELVFTMTATGTVLLESGATALTGALDCLTGHVHRVQNLDTIASEAVNLTTVTGALRGYMVYKRVTKS